MPGVVSRGLWVRGRQPGSLAGGREPGVVSFGSEPGVVTLGLWAGGCEPWAMHDDTFRRLY